MLLAEKILYPLSDLLEEWKVQPPLQEQPQHLAEGLVDEPREQPQKGLTDDPEQPPELQQVPS